MCSVLAAFLVQDFNLNHRISETVSHSYRQLGF